MKLRNFFKNVKQTLTNMFTKPTPKVTVPKTEYKPLTVINYRKPKHPLHKYHFGNFSPIK